MLHFGGTGTTKTNGYKENRNSIRTFNPLTSYFRLLGKNFGISDHKLASLTVGSDI